MARGADVLAMLIPSGAWSLVGEDYDGITFLSEKTITREEFEAGFDKFDFWKSAEDNKEATDKAALIAKLGITADEAKLLFS